MHRKTNTPILLSGYGAILRICFFFFFCFVCLFYLVFDVYDQQLRLLTVSWPNHTVPWVTILHTCKSNWYQFFTPQKTQVTDVTNTYQFFTRQTLPTNVRGIGTNSSHVWGIGTNSSHPRKSRTSSSQVWRILTNSSHVRNYQHEKFEHKF